MKEFSKKQLDYLEFARKTYKKGDKHYLDPELTGSNIYECFDPEQFKIQIVPKGFRIFAEPGNGSLYCSLVDQWATCNGEVVKYSSSDELLENIDDIIFKLERCKLRLLQNI